ncbi:hypothetical protein CMI37_02775 [Candidatus Pacearchaeota archaeon]|nr:hypothetical protein [Candidatus Pacearchaeota archaeon]
MAPELITPELVSIIILVAVPLSAFLYMKLTGKQLPPAVRAALPGIIRALLGILCKTPGVRGLCFVKARANPTPSPILAPPVYSGIITGAEIQSLVQPLGILMHSTVDGDYELTSIAEIKRFLVYYHSVLPYTADAFDCDDHAWLMRAEALKWSKGRMPWGYVEGKSIAGVGPQFGAHAFNFAIDTAKSVYFIDELNVAAGKDEPVVAYPIKSFIARI